MTPGCGEELGDEGLFFFCFCLDVEFIQDIAVVVVDDRCNEPGALVPDLHFNLTCAFELPVVQKRNGPVEAIIFFSSVQGSKAQLLDFGGERSICWYTGKTPY